MEPAWMTMVSTAFEKVADGQPSSDQTSCGESPKRTTCPPATNTRAPHLRDFAIDCKTDLQRQSMQGAVLN